MKNIAISPNIQLIEFYRNCANLNNIYMLSSNLNGKSDQETLQIRVLNNIKDIFMYRYSNQKNELLGSTYQLTLAPQSKLQIASQLFTVVQLKYSGGNSSKGGKFQH